ncbi:L,D-transpeptidase family protein [Methylobacterium sp. J-076]|uniref:L,D-transpeptidase family protein n=1 Tax=Methylobacterium sp. J-076 TaxID=2836655 RepID=UPI001FBA2402|nr:L,D-transpeptidase family protein [Methylobacterium sp. J-076]MCJ2012949.1 L,D-transpeptidase family protein [Methylobacterium sp. J-076]
MRVPRSNQVALAALLAGLMAGGPGRAASPEPTVASVDAVAKPSVAPSPVPAVDPAPGAKPAEPAREGKDAPADAPSNPISDYKPPEPSPDSAPAPATAAAPAVPADPVAAAVLDRLSGNAPLLARLGAKERAALKAFYDARGDKPVWIADGAWTPAAKAVSARLAAADEDGLDIRAYPVPKLADKPDEKAVAEADLRLSAASVLYARDARGGRIGPSAISRLITPTLDLPAADAVLAKLAEAGAKAGDALEGYNPSTEGYRALKAQLASLRGPKVPDAKPLTLLSGPTLKTGMRDPRVPALRTHFGLESRPSATLDHGPGEADLYDATVAEAVAGFQRERGLPGDGVLNKRTVLALANVGRPGKSGDEAELLVNMERWRWLPGELGPDYVLVNVPEFRLRIFRDGKLRDETRVIVGKPESPTPIFSGMMEYAVVNPSWYVPPSILKTMAPKLASYGGKTWGGYEIVRRGGHISLRQPPGEKNALGFIKFMFPNQHAVYLHDTPNRSLFSASTRAFSHGCVRVDDPFRFADVVLPDWSAERLKKLIGKGERTIRLPQKLPVHIAYFTTYVDDAGSLRRVPDIYGYDAPMRAALGLPGGGGPAIAKLAKEPARKVAGDAPRRAAHPAEDADRAPPRRVTHGRGPVRTYAQPDMDAFDTPRAARGGGRPDYGEPGLWTPAPAPVSRSYW